MPKVKINKMGDVDFAKLLLEFQEKQAHRIASVIEKDSTQMLNQTLRHPNRGFRGSRVRVRKEVKTHRGKGVEICVKVHVIDTKSGKPHEVFHHVNDGRRDYKVKKDTRFPLRDSNRTYPRTLNVDSWSGGYKGWVRKTTGQVLGGFPARDYYGQVAKKLRLSVLRRKANKLFSSKINTRRIKKR